LPSREFPPIEAPINATRFASGQSRSRFLLAAFAPQSFHQLVRAASAYIGQRWARSPKTEYMPFENALNEAAGKRIADMRRLLRFMKASSPLYKDAIAS
jgi:hypothetical protein